MVMISVFTAARLLLLCGVHIAAMHVDLPKRETLLLGEETARRDDTSKPGKNTGGDPYAIFEGHVLLKVTVCTKEARDRATATLTRSCQTLAERGLFRSVKSGKCATETVICPPAKARLLAAAHDTKIVTNDAGSMLRNSSGLARSYKGQAPMLQKYHYAEGGTLDQSFYTEWRDLDGIQDRIDEIVKSSGGKAVLDKLSPETNAKKNIRAVRIRGSDWKSGKPRVLVTCQQHAREWIAGMSCTYVVEQLAREAARDHSRNEYFKDVELVVVPIANPDGFSYSTRSSRYWRKNTRQNPGVMRLFDEDGTDRVDKCDGVDLNRNWDVEWDGGESTSEDVCSEIYVGEKAQSEPESQALAAVMAEAPLSLHLDLHSFGGDVLGPWDHTNDPFPRKKVADALGQQLADSINNVHGRDPGFVYGSGDAEMYLVSGSITDYSVTKHANYSYTIELMPAGPDVDYIGVWGFSPGPEEITPQAEELLAAVKKGLDFAKNPGSLEQV